MKINDRHMASFAMGNSPIDKEGFLNKRGEVNKAFQRRYFILKGNLLFYLEKKTDKEPIGVIILEECTVELAENTDSYTFELVFPGVGSRTYILSADTQEEMESWMKAITCANYEYMKLMVSELQRQMDELNLEQATASASRPKEIPPRSASLRKSALLIDIDAARPTVSAKQRQNPFDATEKDLFGAVPFNQESFSDQPRQPRTFEEMHQEFGHYINQKIAEAQKKPQSLF